MTSGANQGIDWILVGLVVGMTLFGLLMVYSAGTKFAQEIGSAQEIRNATDYFLKRQAIWAVVGLAAIFILSRFNYHIYQRLTVLMMVAHPAGVAMGCFLRGRQRWARTAPCYPVPSAHPSWPNWSPSFMSRSG